MALTTAGDQDLQTPSFAADKSSQQAPSASNVKGGDSQPPWSTIEHLRQTFPSAVPEQASTATSMMGLSKCKPLALVRDYLFTLHDLLRILLVPFLQTSTQGLSKDVVVVHPESEVPFLSLLYLMLDHPQIQHQIQQTQKRHFWYDKICACDSDIMQMIFANNNYAVIIAITLITSEIVTLFHILLHLIYYPTLCSS